jgi:hypothetical protein
MGGFYDAVQIASGLMSSCRWLVGAGCGLLSELGDEREAELGIVEGRW